MCFSIILNYILAFSILIIVGIMILRKINNLINPKTPVGKIFGVMFENCLRIKMERKLSKISRIPKRKRSKRDIAIKNILETNLKYY